MIIEVITRPFPAMTVHREDTMIPALAQGKRGATVYLPLKIGNEIPRFKVSRSCRNAASVSRYAR